MRRGAQRIDEVPLRLAIVARAFVAPGRLARTINPKTISVALPSVGVYPDRVGEGGAFSSLSFYSPSPHTGLQLGRVART